MGLVHSTEDGLVPTETEATAVVACRNCGGEQWVCENHQDTAWGGGDGCCRSGAAAPCPVCNREMACAPYAYKLPDWRPIGNWRLERDGREVLVCGGFYMDETTTFRDWEECKDGVWVVQREDFGDFSKDGVKSKWRGENAGSHDEFYWLLPTHFMPMPKAITAVVRPSVGIANGDEPKSPTQSEEAGQ